VLVDESLREKHEIELLHHCVEVMQKFECAKCSDEKIAEHDVSVKLPLELQSVEFPMLGTCR
jgi:hypothetical protein